MLDSATLDVWGDDDMINLWSTALYKKPLKSIQWNKYVSNLLMQLYEITPLETKKDIKTLTPTRSKLNACVCVR